MRWSRVAADRPAGGEQPVAAAAGEPGAPAPGTDAGLSTEPPVRARRPLYPRLLRLRHVHPNAWQRAALGEGALALALVLVLADLASAWTLLVLPLGVAVVVKAHDVLAGLLGGAPAAAVPGTDPPHDDGAAPHEGAAPEVGAKEARS